jgi:hypothetical protein
VHDFFQGGRGQRAMALLHADPLNK